MATISGELDEESGEMILVSRETVQKFWVDRNGNFLVSTVDGNEWPEGGVEVPFGPPEHADQVWDFDKLEYKPSVYVATTRENAWRIQELNDIPDEIAKVEDEDPAAIGTVQDWRDYRKELRLWVDTNADFPFGTRPTKPQ